jgi:putative IMPACT (imprinted ancient) family translation regulator
MTLGTKLKELRSNEDTSNAGTKWTIDEDKILVQEIVDNKSYEEIALEHKRTILSIKSRVISHIIYPKYKDDIENNIEKISIEYKIDNELITKYIKKLKTNNDIQKSVNSNKPDTKTDKTEILEYLQQLDTKMNDINTKLDMLLNQFKS